MKKYITFITLLFLGVTGAALAQGTPNEHANNNAFVTHSAPVCLGPAGPETARCHAWVVTDAAGVPQVGTADPAKGNSSSRGGHGGGGTPPPPPPAPPASAYGPVQFQTAYGLVDAATLSTNATVAIVDAYDNPTIEQDLAVYSTAYGLPSCTTANGCFKKVSQTGSTRYPRANADWALEIALDVQAVHAVCPHCKILLVEASSNSLNNLFAAESYAASHATVVSNSWGASEFSSESAYDSYFDHPGVPITVSSGDNGYGASWPASSPYVTAVGGTTLALTPDNTRSAETTWSGSGSGCSAYEAQPAWQTALGLSDCTNRMVADVSADADPATGAAVYDSYGYGGQKGWFTVGGTSLAAPIIAAVYALAGNKADASSVYTSASSLNIYDVIDGSNGSCGSYLCAAGLGYDGPTGLGTPVGLGAF
jgi:subtilase family serine protease